LTCAYLRVAVSGNPKVIQISTTPKRNNYMATAISLTSADQFSVIPLDSLVESATNPRRTFDEAKIQDLAESIRTQGLIMPLVVRPKGDVYEIVAGARRYRAAKLASIEAVPARIVALTDEQTLAWQLIENSQRVDVHPYEEAEGYRRLLQMPGYDVPAIAEKTGKSESHIHSRIKLLDLIDPVARAFLEDKITATHALLIARLPQPRQAEAYEHCWRKDWQDKEAHLLPARSLSAWIEENLYLHLADAPFPTDDPDLAPEAGACPQCEKRSGFNTRLFHDVEQDVCLDAQCWKTKREVYLARTLSARPDLIQIDAGGWKPERDRRPGALRKNEYIVIDTAFPDGKEHSGISNTLCESVRDALVVDGPGAGTIQPVCADARCPVHGNPDAPAPLSREEREAEQAEWQKQQQLERQRAERARAKRLELLNSITENFTTPLSAEQTRLLLMALVHLGDLEYTAEAVVDLYYAPHEGESEERMDQDVLLSILRSADERALFSVLIRLALVGHLREPHPDQPDYLKQAVSAFGVERANRKPQKKTPPAKAKVASKKPKAKKGGAR
jgi:ParB family transcriptional regulator, chromosome partitioning protein